MAKQINEFPPQTELTDDTIFHTKDGLIDKHMTKDNLMAGIAAEIIVDASTSVKGVTQLSNSINSTSETTAATPLAVKTVADQVASKAESSVSIVAGEGLVDGGNLSANVTISMGTPSTLSVGTSNSTTSTSHTHAVTFPVTSVAGRGNNVTLTSADLTDATTVGKNFLTSLDPAAITFPRVNADNTVSYLDSATFRSAIGSGVGSVTSVAVSVPTGLQVAGSPITSSGTVAITLQSGYSIPTTANQTLWSTAYTDRNKWDGGATGLVAATGRTSLGLGTAATLNTGTGAGDIPIISQLNTRLGTTGNLGNAALSTVTTSPTDTTLNSLMKTGDAGWLGLNTTTETNADNLTVSGNYQLQSGTPASFSNFPSWAEPSRSTVLVMGNMSPYGVQIYYDRTLGRSAMRTYSGTFGIWKEFWTDANLVKTISTTDTTAGRVMVNGVHGVGSTTAQDLAALSTGAAVSAIPNSFALASNAGVFNVAYGIPFSASGIKTSYNANRGTFIFTSIGGSARGGFVSSSADNTYNQFAEWWTSANLVKTTSAVDTTAGSVLTTGYAGLLQTGAVTIGSASADANTKTQFALTFCLGEANRPSWINVSTGHGIFTLPISSNRGIQLAFSPADTPTNGTNRLSLRTYTGGVFADWVDVYTTGNTSANVQTMLGSADNSAIRSNISAAKKTTVVTVSGTTHNLDTADESAYHNFTNAGTKSLTVRPNSTHALATDGAWVITNDGAGDLTIIEGSGVVVKPRFGGTLVLAQDMTATIQKVGTDTYHLIGQTVPA